MENNIELDELKEDELEVNQEPLLSKEGIEEKEDTNVKDLEAIYDIPVKVSAILGKTKIKVNKLLGLNKGAIIELDKKVGEAIDIYVNNRLVARGEVVVVEDKLGITMTEIVKSDRS